jgi:outer membrane immunogenic protein
MRFKRFTTFVAVVAIAAPLAISKPAQAYSIHGGFDTVKSSYRNMALQSAFSAGMAFATLVFLDFVISQALHIEPLFTELYGNRSAHHPLAYNDDQTPTMMMAYAPFKGLVTKAPPAMRSYGWQGAYIGGHVGWGFGTDRWTDTFGDVAGIAGSSLGMKTNGFIGGAQLGYNFQAGHWVYGVEGQFSWSAIKGDESGSLPPATGTFDSRNRWLASVTGRVGYALPRSLIYLKGGAAWTDYSHDFLLNGVAGPLIFPGTSGTRSGWTIGGGIERAINDNWSFRTEYAFYDFGSEGYNTSHPLFGPARMNIEQQIHTVTFGVNYRFNAAPVSARY